MSDERRAEGEDVAAYLAGAIAQGVAKLRTDQVLRITLQEVEHTSDGRFELHCRTDAGFDIDVRVELTGWKRI